MPSPIGLARPYIKDMVDIFDAEDMRNVRNEVRQFMTHDTTPIGLARQINWYRDVYVPEHQASNLHGFVMQYDNEPIGYGLVSRRQSEYWVSGGLVPEARGKGYGEELFTFLTSFVTAELEAPACYLDVRRDNDPAVHLYQKIGYEAIAEVYDGDMELIVMRFGNGGEYVQE